MNIRIVSTVSAEDENRVAPTIQQAVAAILDLLPIAYSVRIETTDAKIYQTNSKPSSTDSLMPNLDSPKLFDS